MHKRVPYKRKSIRNDMDKHLSIFFATKFTIQATTFKSIIMYPLPDTPDSDKKVSQSCHDAVFNCIYMMVGSLQSRASRICK